MQNLAQWAYEAWVQNDALAASTWLAEQPAGEIRHAAAERTIASKALGEPSAKR